MKKFTINLKGKKSVKVVAANKQMATTIAQSIYSNGGNNRELLYVRKDEV